MKKEKELRVYIIGKNDEFLEEHNFYTMSNEDIINHCEETGLIYSLNGYEHALNNQELYLEDYFIKFLYV